MIQITRFTVNADRFDPYKNFIFRIIWDGHFVTGESKISVLKRTTEVVKNQEGDNLSSNFKSLGEPNMKKSFLSERLLMTPSLKNGRIKSRTLAQDCVYISRLKISIKKLSLKPIMKAAI